MHHNGTFIMVLVFGLVAGWALTTWIRAKYGYPLDDGAGNPVYRQSASRDEVLKAMETALVERDEQIAALEKRIRVLERIATDRKTALGEEIDSLHT